MVIKSCRTYNRLFNTWCILLIWLLRQASIDWYSSKGTPASDFNDYVFWHTLALIKWLNMSWDWQSVYGRGPNYTKLHNYSHPGPCSCCQMCILHIPTFKSCFGGLDSTDEALGYDKPAVLIFCSILTLQKGQLQGGSKYICWKVIERKSL